MTMMEVYCVLACTCAMCMLHFLIPEKWYPYWGIVVCHF